MEHSQELIAESKDLIARAETLLQQVPTIGSQAIGAGRMLAIVDPEDQSGPLH